MAVAPRFMRDAAVAKKQTCVTIRRRHAEHDDALVAAAPDQKPQRIEPVHARRLVVPDVQVDDGALRDAPAIIAEHLVIAGLDPDVGDEL